MAQVEGEVFGSRWNCVLDYGTSTSWNSVSVNGTCIFRSRGYGMNLTGFYAHVDINGNTNSTENTSFYSPTGGWVDKSIISHSQSFSRTHSDYTIYINACIDRRGSSYAPGKSIPTAYITIPAIEHHTVAFNANGGSGAPGSQTKWYGTVLTLSSTRPTRTGYTFQGWATSASGTVAYQPGGRYSADSDVTLYAVWKANTWTVRFDANGGSGAPAAQTKTYGIDLKLSTTKPTRALYNFLGWGTSSSSSSAVYQPGGTYTVNADITLYAVWELAWIAPKLSNHNCFRCNQNGVADDLGTYCRLVGDWVTDRTVQSITVTVNDVTTTISGSGKAGSIAVTLGAGALSAETSYTVKLVITDELGSGEWNWTIAATHYILDFAPNGSIGVNTAANGSKLDMTVDMPINGSIFYGGFIPETGTAPSYVKLGTWSLASGNVYTVVKSILNFEINFNSRTMKGLVERAYQSAPDATSKAFYIALSHNFGEESHWPSLLGRVISETDIELWIKNNKTGTWRRGEYTVHGASGKWIPSSELTTIEPKGTFCSTIFTPQEFSVGSGLALSDRCVLSTNDNAIMHDIFSASADKPKDLNTVEAGICGYDRGTANAPTDWGVCITMFVGDSNEWKFQLAFPTLGEPHWRRRVNEAGWSKWYSWTTT